MKTIRSRVSKEEQLIAKLTNEVPEDTVRIAIQRLAEMGVTFKADEVDSTQDQWANIVRDAAKGRLTRVGHGRKALVLVRLDKLLSLAANVRSPRTMGDILRAHPGVSEREAPRINVRGGPVRTSITPEEESGD